MQDPNEWAIQVGSAIVRDPKYRDLDCDAASLIYEISDGDRSRYGYVYFSNNEWEARGPKDDDRAIFDMFEALQTAMYQQTGRKWLKALVQIDRIEQSVDIKFEYDDPSRWVVNPADIESLVAEIKP